jgi:hypothetical protein
MDAFGSDLDLIPKALAQLLSHGNSASPHKPSSNHLELVKKFTEMVLDVELYLQSDNCLALLSCGAAPPEGRKLRLFKNILTAADGTWSSEEAEKFAGWMSERPKSDGELSITVKYLKKRYLLALEKIKPVVFGISPTPSSAAHSAAHSGELGKRARPAQADELPVATRARTAVPSAMLTTPALASTVDAVLQPARAPEDNASPSMQPRLGFLERRKPQP